MNPSRATIPLILPHQCDSDGGRIRGVLLYHHTRMQVDYIVLLSFQEEFLDEFTSLRDGLKDLRVLSDILKYCLEYHKNLI